MNLNGKRVAVTGGFGALGVATVNVLLAAGARVAAIDRADGPPPNVSIGEAKPFGGVDIGDAAVAEATFEKAAEALGGLDALVNIAGTFRWEKLADGGLDTWDFLYNVNLRTAVAASKAALPFLLEGQSASIVNIGAMGALKAATGMGAYAASKAGIFKLTEALAEELKEKDITVNAILPSIIDTQPNRADMPTANFAHWVKPEQIARVIAFLLSDDARAITGALIPVAGRV
jgi:NAD(P)-dependent dehydrogenase (short-subunit alcohol dehydrogenase family)